MANVPGSKRPLGTQRPTGTRFRTDSAASQPSARRPQPGGTRFPGSSGSQTSHRHTHGAVHPAYRTAPQSAQRGSAAPVVIAVIVALAVIVGAVVFVFPRLFGAGDSGIEAGQQVTISIPDGSSGDAIASILSEHHIIEDPSEYYAAVKKLNAEMSLKPGDYQFETLQDPLEVVKQLVAGPNASGAKLTVPEGKTVAQTAQLVEAAYGIPVQEFMAQAKASTYASSYPFLANVANDSLEGFLFPKTYSFSGTPTADQVIRAMLDQYQADVANSLDFASARSLIAARYGLEFSDYDLLILASVVEREGLNASQRSHVASVFFNRLSGLGDFSGRPFLESDATLMYETGGEVTANDIQTIDSPYNSYQNAGLPPTPICSPSVEALRATLEPMDTSDLYFYITQDEEFFSQTYDEHMQSWE